MPQFLSPGYAATSAMEDFLAQRAARQFAREKFEAERQLRDQELHERQEEGKARREDLLMRAKDREVRDFEKRMSGMVKGDVPDPEMQAQAVKFGFGHAFRSPAMPEGQQGPTQPEFVGTKEERLAEQARERQQRFVETLPPGSPERRALEAEAAGLKVPPKFFGGAVEETQPVMRVNPRTGEVEQVGTAPKGAHFVTEPPPKDTSARELRESTHRDQVHQQAITELDKWAAPIEGHIQGINDLGIMLNARTPQADALIAPLVLKATVSGTGSGFRMTRPEIENVVGGRSKWQSLEAALNKWSLDPKQALSITDEQRTQLRDLAKAIRKKGNDLHQKIVKARHAMDDATDVAGINKIRTQLQEDLFAPEAEEPSPMAGKSAADIIAEIRKGKK